MTGALANRGKAIGGIRRYMGLDVHKAYVYGYELQENGSGRGFQFPDPPRGRPSS